MGAKYDMSKPGDKCFLNSELEDLCDLHRDAILEEITKLEDDLNSDYYNVAGCEELESTVSDIKDTISELKKLSNGLKVVIHFN